MTIVTAIPISAPLLSNNRSCASIVPSPLTSIRISRLKKWDGAQKHPCLILLFIDLEEKESLPFYLLIRVFLETSEDIYT